MNKMKNILIALLAFLSLSASCQQQTGQKKNPAMIHPASSIHSFKVPSLDGGEIDFNSFRGKKILIVNTASECGYTGQYEDLQKLYETYGQKLVVVGFPSNDFGGQEPGTGTEIRSFCTSKFHVTFPMAAKVSIKGKEAAPIYQWLTRKELNGSMDASVSWNFNKFLVDENGHLIGHFPSRINPMDDTIVDQIK